jgi:hypothetical protein
MDVYDKPKKVIEEKSQGKFDHKVQMILLDENDSLAKRNTLPGEPFTLFRKRENVGGSQ